MKYLKSKLFTSLFATLLILSFCMAKPAQVHASNADSAKMAPWLTISKRNISFTAMAEQQELTTLQLKEADVLTVHYMFPGAYRNTAH
mgnify:CR=1 FL=1